MGRRIEAVLVIVLLRNPSNVDVLRAVAEATGVDATCIVSRDQSRETCYARHLAMFAYQHWLKLGPVEIGRMFGRDHASVIQGIRRIAMELRTRPETAADVRRIDGALR